MGESSAKAKVAPSFAGWAIPQSWVEAAEAVAYDSSTSPPPIAFVCGPGNSGKSTFSRLLLNVLLQRYPRVGYLDTDVGQPEFTAPGCLSLHILDKQTPDLTMLYLKTPERCFFFGDVCSRKDTKAYLDFILRLYDYFLNEYYHMGEPDGPRKSMIPLVINTSGWVKGVGYDMLVTMLRYMSPTHVVQIRTSAEGKNLPTGMFWLDGDQKASVSVIEISAAHRDSSNRPVLIKKDARIVRDLRLIAYFRQCLPRDLGFSTYKELSESLGSIPSFEIPLSRIKITRLRSQVSSTETYLGLNTTIVGLAVSSWVSTSSENSTPWCVGLGIVRAVDISRDLLYVITPVPRGSLEKVDLLLVGSIEIPACLTSGTESVALLHKLEPPELDVQIAKTEKLLSRILSH